MEHIATVVGDVISISWHVIGKDAAAFLGFSQTDVQDGRTRDVAILARVKTPAGEFLGTAWTSRKDLFELPVGMPLALDRALENAKLDRPARTSVWDIVGADIEASALIRSKVYAQEKAIEIADRLARRSKAIYRKPYVQATPSQKLAAILRSQATASVLSEVLAVVQSEKSQAEKRVRRSR